MHHVEGNRSTIHTWPNRVGPKIAVERIVRAIGLELLKGKTMSLKFILNESAIIFFPGILQHRDTKMEGLSYEDDYRGNALAGIVASDHVEIRFHSAFSDERVRNIWSRVLAVPEVASAGLGGVYYQGRKIQ